jgi:MFS transporter, UMF1 family
MFGQLPNKNSPRTMSSTSASPPIVKNDQRTLTGWAFFDWANSAYALVITVAIFPIYFISMTTTRDPITNEVVSTTVRFLGRNFENSALYAYALAFSYLVVAILSPTLSSIADSGGYRKRFMRFFTTVGALACISLFFFKSIGMLWVGVLGFVLATIGFAGGIVFYNSYLPIIATEDRYDEVSAKGFSYGFVGSVILLIVNLVVILNFKFFGFSESAKATQMAFVMVGLWWLGFAQIPFRRLPDDQKSTGPQTNLVRRGYADLSKVWKVIRRHPMTLAFLISFFLFNAGVQTVLLMASTFAEKELEFSSSELIAIVLVLQIVAIGGAWLSAKISERRGNKFSLVAMLLIWVVICAAGYTIRKGDDVQFYLLATAVGLVMGGVQSLSRSTYAKFLPEDTPDTASYFSFYDVMDKTSTTAGLFLFGLVEQLTGGMQQSILTLGGFFVVSVLLLRWVRIGRMQAD